jgi:hypothetical protein
MFNTEEYIARVLWAVKALMLSHALWSLESTTEHAYEKKHWMATASQYCCEDYLTLRVTCKSISDSYNSQGTFEKHYSYLCFGCLWVLQQFQNQELSIRLYILCSIPEDPDKTCENDVFDEKFAYSFLFKEWIRNTSYFLPLLISLEQL